MYWLDLNESSSVGQSLFYADTEADIDNLPTSKSYGVKQDYKYTDPTIEAEHPVMIGTQCFVIGTGVAYILNSQDNWIKIGG